MLNLLKVGSYVYWDHPSTEVLCAAWAIGDGPIQMWIPGQPCPAEIFDHVTSGGMVSGWNVGGFERIAWRACLGPTHGWPVPVLEQYDDTAAMAAAMALPRALEDIGPALRLEIKKDAAGRKIMLEMCKPRRFHKGDLPGVPYWYDDEIRHRQLRAYCKRDVEVERAVRKRLIPLSEGERQIWLLDQIINDRGVQIDLDLVRSMEKIVKQEKKRLDQTMKHITGGAITATSQVQALTEWLREQGAAVANLDKRGLDTILADPELPSNCADAIVVRREAAKASTGKLATAQICVGKDARARGLLLYHGASTGRWTSRILQLHNFVRGSGDKLVPVLLQGDAVLLDMIHGNPLAMLAKSMRAIIRAEPGRRFVAADFSQIEARVTAWIAGEAWKLKAFEAYDRGEGPGMYEVAASGIYGCPVEDVTEEDPRRQTGKTAELAGGFGGGVTALAKMAANYGIDMAVAFPGLWTIAEEATRERAMKRYEECLARSDSSADVLTEMAWLACELTKIGWRAANPKIVSSWKALDNAAIEAVLHPGTQVQAVHVDHDGHPTELLPVTFRTAFGYLWMRLPSGRCLAYPAPRCERVTVPWADLTKPVDQREKRLAVTVLGVGQNNQFMRYALYPGLTVQHAVQATARDLMAAGMLRAEAQGYPIVLTVHDEVLAEMAHGEGDLEEFKKLLCVPQQWTTGLPIAASGWEGPRFRK